MRLHRLLKTIIENRRGATTIEYALILAFIVLAMLVALQALAGQNLAIWNYVFDTSGNAISQTKG
ncbi:Flp family type IVb pilin [Novosphingobium gossypii]|uniref:Flp family type IVb pilin n=1 Tax=Novosphingobium gossypii TaxID=1604774 RepID=UPI003D1FCA11